MLRNEGSWKIPPAVPGHDLATFVGGTVGRWNEIGGAKLLLRTPIPIGRPRLCHAAQASAAVRLES